MKINKDVALVTGGFDPLHSGHVRYFNAAKKECKYLVVGINSDSWLERKKGFKFMDWKERSKIIKNLVMVNEVIKFDDDDDTAIDAISICLKKFKSVTFMNGGDRNKKNIPEIGAFTNEKLKFKFNVGGKEKLNSSSNILRNFYINYSKTKKSHHHKIMAPWGNHQVIFDPQNNYKIKRIIVKPLEMLSLQYHNHRSEHWIIVSGKCEAEIDSKKIKLTVGDHLYIPKLSVHRIRNTSKNNDLIFIEVNIGEYIEEDDIIRVSDIYGRANK